MDRISNAPKLHHRFYEAMKISAEHVDWAINEGFTHTEIIISVGLDQTWLWPTRDELVEALAVIWARRLNRPVLARKAA